MIPFVTIWERFCSLAPVWSFFVSAIWHKHTQNMAQPATKTTKATNHSVQYLVEGLKPIWNKNNKIELDPQTLMGKPFKNCLFSFGAYINIKPNKVLLWPCLCSLLRRQRKRFVSRWEVLADFSFKFHQHDVTFPFYYSGAPWKIGF